MPQAHVFDFHKLADGIVRNNVGCGGITVAARGSIQGDAIVLERTDQRLPVTGAFDAKGPWLWFEVLGFAPGEEVRVKLVGSSTALTQRPAPPLMLLRDN